MNIFDGLYGYEVILLILGALFFIVLMVVFVILIAQKRPYGKLMMSFTIPLIMMGFPSIKSFQYKDGVISIDKMTHDLQQNPTDTEKREELRRRLADVVTRPAADPAAIASIANAQFALGEHRAAEVSLQKAIVKAPDLPKVVALKKKLDLEQSLTKLTAQVEQHTADPAVKQELKQTVEEASKLSVASPQLLATLAQAKQLTGNHAEAAKLADTALKIDPNLVLAQKVKATAIAAHQ
jgi:tetratricopeptide (TPR) repeat protein